MKLPRHFINLFVLKTKLTNKPIMNKVTELNHKDMDGCNQGTIEKKNKVRTNELLPPIHIQK